MAFGAISAANHGDLGQALRTGATGIYDANWYRHIAGNGYVDPHLGGPVKVFYPGYPMAVAALYWPAKVLLDLTLGSTETIAQHVVLPAAMLLVSNLALLGAMVILWRLYAPRLGPAATILGLGFLLSWPTAFFLSIGYSESLFILVVACAFLCAQRGRWLEAGILGAAACLIRFPGAFLLIPLAMIWLASTPRRNLPALAGGVIFALGAAAYPSWLWITSGDPLAYLHLQETHHRSLAGPIAAMGLMLQQARDGARAVLGRPSGQRLVDVPTIAANWLGLLAGIVSAIAGWTRLRAYEIAWIVVVLLVPLVSGTGESLDRYVLAAFPAFFLLGWWLRRWPIAAVALMALSSAWLFVLSYNFARVIWVG